MTAWPPHTYEVRPWRQRVARGPRVDKLTREITVSLPPLIRDLDYPLDRALSAAAAASAGNLTDLDLVHGRTLHSLSPLLLRTESVDSSKIENLEASLTDYARALLGSGANASAVAMASATWALAGIVGDTALSRRIRSEAILTAHRELFRRHPDEAHRAGRYRTVQNWIGGSDYAPRGALHVPPPPETVPAYLEDLYAFANRDDLPPVVQAAIVHAQFESIHPFIDGNGRIGRTLIHAVLRRRRVTRHLTVPVASGLVADRDRYFAALHAYREGDPSVLVTMLAWSIDLAVVESRATAATLTATREQWRHAAGAPRSGTTTSRLLDALTEEPIVNVPRVAERFSLTEPEARAEIDRLEQIGVLAPVRGSRRAPVWTAPPVLHEIADLGQRIVRTAQRQEQQQQQARPG